jgi:DNA gyrase subunit A
MSDIFEVDFNEEGRKDFLTYCEEILTDRAIPSAEDGLLSSQRKLIWTMENYLKMDSKSKTKKCNSIVGSTLMTSYVHGNAACYGVLVKMVQPFLMRYPLLDGQGALGTQESNDMVASDRYTEAKPSKFADLMMEGYEKNVVPTKRTYNDEYDEPVVLPSLFPNAICNGKQTVAIGLAHNSLPHCLTEVCDAIIKYIQTNGQMTIDELLEIMPGPDFPLDSTVVNQKVIKEAFLTGHSSQSLRVRGNYEIKGDLIIFNTIPYRVYRNKIKEQIRDNIDEFDKIIDDFDDESNLGVNRLVFHLKKGVSPKVALGKIFALTDLETTLSYNMNYIINGTPKLCSMFDLIDAYVQHQNVVLIKAAEYDKGKAETRKHVLEGLLVALGNIDMAIKIIRGSDNKSAAVEGLTGYFTIDSIQANAILDMKLSRLTKLDKKELEDELLEKIQIINSCNKIIEDSDYRNSILISKITDMRNKYGDKRRTTLIDLDEPKEEAIEIEPEKCVVIMTKDGNIKRVPSTNFKVQHRNGKGVKNLGEIVSATIRTNTIDSLMVFSDKGRMYRISVNEIPETTKGQPIKSLISMEVGENPTLIYSIYRDTDAKYVLFTTANGTVKKTPLEEYVKTKKKSGIAAITLREGDKLASVNLIKDENLILITKSGMAIQFNSSEIGTSSRATTGVKGISLKEGDFVVATLPVRNKTDDLAIFTERGLGKRVPIKEFPVQKRAGKGLIAYKPTPTSGNVISGSLISNEDSVLIVGDNSGICISAKDIPISGRASVGIQLIKNNQVMAVSKV